MHARIADDVNKELHSRKASKMLGPLENTMNRRTFIRYLCISFTGIVTFNALGKNKYDIKLDSGYEIRNGWVLTTADLYDI